MPDTMTVNTSDWNRLLKGSQLGDRLMNGLGVTGNIADKAQSDIDAMIAVNKQLQTDKTNAQTDAANKQKQLDQVPAQVQTAHDKGFSEGVASVPSNPSTQPTQTTAPVDMGNYEENGLSIETTVGNKKYITNYKKVK